MNRRPRVLSALAMMFLAAAISMPAQVMWLYGHTLMEWSAIINKFTLLNGLVFFGLIANTFLLWRVSPALRWTIPTLLLGLMCNNAIAGFYHTDFSLWTTTLGTLAFSFLNIPLLEDRVQWILQHPERRWWIRAQRRRLSVPIYIEGTRLSSSKAETFDVSETGVFIPGTADLGVGDWIHVRLQFDSLVQVRCQARVVRRETAKGNYPAGVGVHFEDLSWKRRRDLRRQLQASSANL